MSRLYMRLLSEMMLTKRQPQIHTDAHSLSRNELTEAIIGCAYAVANTLGIGFLEKVYENALVHELRKQPLVVIQQAPITVRSNGVVAGQYAADLVVEDQVIVELKASKEIDKAHVAQCVNYLKATGIGICLLINFGKPKVEIKRLVL